MPDPGTTADAVRICDATALTDGGLAHGFNVREGAYTVPAFVLRFEGRVVGYLNRCAHVPTEMDWQVGRFLDDSGRWILCATHGAAYAPDTGLCVAGPCVGRRLTSLRVEERDGQVYWYPSPLHQPLAPPRSPSEDGAPGPG